jgi:N-methylhydantoinase A
MLLADPTRLLIKSIQRPIEMVTHEEVGAHFDALARPGISDLIADGAAAAAIVERRSVDLRYTGQSFTLTVPWARVDEAAGAFNALHQARYGHALDLPIELVNIRCELTARRTAVQLPKLPHRPVALPRSTVVTLEHPAVAVFDRNELCVGQRIDGPALVVETMATTFIDAPWQATVDLWGHLHLATNQS